MSRPLWVAIAADAAAWAAVQIGAGYLAHRLPDRLLDHDGWFLRARAWEREGRFYVETARVRRWKHLIPETGALFPGGVSKRTLAGAGAEHLTRALRENRRAEIAHWLMLAPTPVFVVCNRPLLAPFMPVYALAVNLPCMLLLRYNRFRFVRTRARVLRRSSGGSPAGT